MCPNREGFETQMRMKSLSGFDLSEGCPELLIAQRELSDQDPGKKLYKIGDLSRLESNLLGKMVINIQFTSNKIHLKHHSLPGAN